MHLLTPLDLSLSSFFDRGQEGARDCEKHDRLLHSSPSVVCGDMWEITDRLCTYKVRERWGNLPARWAWHIPLLDIRLFHGQVRYSETVGSGKCHRLSLPLGECHSQISLSSLKITEGNYLASMHIVRVYTHPNVANVPVRLITFSATFFKIAFRLASSSLVCFRGGDQRKHQYFSARPYPAYVRCPAYYPSLVKRRSVSARTKKHRYCCSS